MSRFLLCYCCCLLSFVYWKKRKRKDKKMFGRKALQVHRWDKSNFKIYGAAFRHSTQSPFMLSEHFQLQVANWLISPLSVFLSQRWQFLKIFRTPHTPQPDASPVERILENSIKRILRSTTIFGLLKVAQGQGRDVAEHSRSINHIDFTNCFEFTALPNRH